MGGSRINQKFGRRKNSKQRSLEPQLKSPVKAKKHLGQHFLKDESIAQRISETLTLEGYQQVLEIGPGTGVLTKYLLLRDLQLTAMDLDEESILYLKHSFALQHPKVLEKNPHFRIVEADFLKQNLKEFFADQPFAITGNFPYNISTQIVFKMLEYKNQIPEFTGMFQKEVAKRICEPHGSKVYGILSVLVQAFYQAEYLFTVHPQVFDPPPKVQSGVIRLSRIKENRVEANESLFFKLVKLAFNQRRKTLRNSLKSMGLSDNLTSETIFDLRPEQLSVTDFINLTTRVAHDPI